MVALRRLQLAAGTPTGQLAHKVSDRQAPVRTAVTTRRGGPLRPAFSAPSEGRAQWSTPVATDVGDTVIDDGGGSGLALCAGRHRAVGVAGALGPHR